MSKPIPSIQKYMTTCPVTIPRSTTLADATKLMTDKKIRHLPVVDDGELAGMVSDRDLKLAASFREVDMKVMIVADLMVAEVYTCDADAPLDDVCLTMAAQKYGSAVVTQNGKVVGIFTTVDALTAFAELLHTRLGK